ncbi:2'-5' RNA ligase family protein [Dyadobacter sp. CY323]|uniref:2'-5' RNA ligase family protein n=1 Tax=Dyadobacter sp. CY323 TaxID=2907302 RepID=UPI001F3741FB|nr:2'-5' RNA ligase family protein [Dyadobacter sp. CY323]MCE6987598.1 2'-5' RNA ligase family protein [Dyadobacter sp. CY323]
MKRMSVYTLVISPDERIVGLVRTLKKRLQQQLGRNYGSVNSAAHMTLILFLAHDENYPLILAEFKRVLAGLAPFQVALSGFGEFADRPECVFYIQPDDDSVDIILERCKEMGTNFSKFLRRTHTDKWDIVGRKKPHMSVARSLTKSELDVCKELLNEDFVAEFQCNAFAIRKLNEEKGQYEIVDIIPLLGHEYMAGQQMRLF